MKKTIFGATGGSGLKLTQPSLTGGVEVMAYARNPAKLAVKLIFRTFL